MALGLQATVVVLAAFCMAWYTNRGPFHRPSIVTEHLNTSYDYVIVGAGSAGSVLAARLSEDNDATVLLLEAGGYFDENPLFNVPFRTVNLPKTEHDWEYYTEPQTHSCFAFDGNRSFWPRGRVLGGTSIINTMMYTRGNRFDYDEFANNGLKGWGYKDVLPYFLKSEDIQIDELKSSKYHVSGGPLAVSGGRVSPLADTYLQAGRDLGYKVTDYNGADQEGFSPIQLNVRHGVRSSTSVEFLGRTVGRHNLHIAIRTFVTRVNIEDMGATGVFIIRNGRKHFIEAKKEVILSAGVMNTPQVLMLSGVGPKSHLDKLNIPVVQDLPVGQNLQDHPIVFLYSKINASYSITPSLVSSRWTQWQYTLFGTGPLAIAGSEAAAFLYFDEAKRGVTYPDIQFVLVSSFDAFNFKRSMPGYFDENDDPDQEGFSVMLVPTRPHSTGAVTLRSSDPFDYPALDPRYLTDDRDITYFIKAIRIWEQYIQTPTMKKLGVDIEEMRIPACAQHDFRSDAYWECYVRMFTIAGSHQCCSAKMGADDDPSAVVDAELRVKGIKGLRVVDASVFPNLLSGNPNAPVIMAAEKAADLIRGIDSVKDIREGLSI